MAVTVLPPRQVPRPSSLTSYPASGCKESVGTHRDREGSSVQAKEAEEAKHRHAMELRRQIEAGEARTAQKRAAARSEGAAARAAEGARQALVEVSDHEHAKNTAPVHARHRTASPDFVSHLPSLVSSCDKPSRGSYPAHSSCHSMLCMIRACTTWYAN